LPKKRKNDESREWIRAIRRFLFRILTDHDKRSVANLMALAWSEGEPISRLRMSTEPRIDALDSQ